MSLTSIAYLSTWLAALATGIGVLIWKRASWEWWLVAAFVLLLPFGPLALGIVSAIGAGKFLIAGWGRRSVFSKSRLEAGSPAVPPRGLLEHTSYESDTRQ